VLGVPTAEVGDEALAGEGGGARRKGPALGDRVGKDCDKGEGAAGPHEAARSPSTHTDTPYTYI
jgi:hypothetical protein